MRTSLTRALAGTAIVGTAVFTAAGVANATTPPPKASTSLSISTSATTITDGMKVTVSGVLLSGSTPLDNKIVLLDRLNSKKQWVPIAAKPTNAAGSVSFVRMPEVTSSFKLVFLGNAKFATSHSGVATVTVKPTPKTPTVLSIRLIPPAKAGQADVIRGTLTADKAPVAGKRVWLERWNATTKRFVLVTGEFTGKLGRVAFLVKPRVTTHYRLEFFGTATLAKTHSAVVTVTVK
jgi:hypothetical protein